ncbi:hypothetical protein [uncultured Draconibacterium sp.]|uniref:hypothetical protein n=1 Tax=uncultured Draconibacterium sp. TaxID=1573823 RepID=UPI0029C984E8|nr:hypothetical protein [uncultured Draconibacterium sp.]
MKYTILLFTFLVAATLAGNAQDQAKQDQPTFTPEETKMYESAIARYDEYQEAIKAFNEATEKFAASDSILKAGYIASVDSFTHIEMVKQETPIQYVKNGELVVEDDYQEKRTRKPLPATQQGYAAYVEELRLAIKK